MSVLLGLAAPALAQSALRVGETVTIQLSNGLVRVPRNALAAGQDGLVTGATLAELQARAVPAPAGEPAPGQ